MLLFLGDLEWIDVILICLVLAFIVGLVMLFIREAKKPQPTTKPKETESEASADYMNYPKPRHEVKLKGFDSSDQIVMPPEPPRLALRAMMRKSLSDSRSLVRISKKLAEPFGFHKSPSFDAILKHTRKREEALEELLDLAYSKYNCWHTIKHHNVSREYLRAAFKTLRASGAGQYEAGHYVAASALVFSDTLDYIIKHFDGAIFRLPGCEEGGHSDMIAAITLLDYFRDGETGPIPSIEGYSYSERVQLQHSSTQDQLGETDSTPISKNDEKEITFGSFDGLKLDEPHFEEITKVDHVQPQPKQKRQIDPSKMKRRKRNALISVAAVILFLLLSNPSQKALAEHLGIPSSERYIITRKSNYFIMSVWQDNYYHKKYLGIAGNFFELD